MSSLAFKEERVGSSSWKKDNCTLPSSEISVLPIQVALLSEAGIVSAPQIEAPRSSDAARIAIRFIATNLINIAVERKKGDLKVAGLPVTLDKKLGMQISR